MIHAVARDDSIQVQVREGHNSAVAELSHIEMLPLPNGIALPESERPWFFFNRIFTSPGIRAKGHGSCVLRVAITMADELKVNIINTINPYGDLTREQIEDWFARYGFEKLADGIVVRLHK